MYTNNFELCHDVVRRTNVKQEKNPSRIYSWKKKYFLALKSLKTYIFQKRLM